MTVNSDQKTSFDQSADGYEVTVSAEEAQLFSLSETQKHLEELRAELLCSDCCSGDNYMPFYHVWKYSLSAAHVFDSRYQRDSFLIVHDLICRRSTGPLTPGSRRVKFQEQKEKEKKKDW